MTYITFMDVVADSLMSMPNMTEDVIQGVPKSLIMAISSMTEEEARASAIAIVRTAASIGHGGADYYLCRNDSYARAVRNARIRAEFNGRNLPTVAKNHKVSKTTVYRVCGKK